MYNAVYLPYLDNPRPTEIFFGGSSSGKSVFIAQRAVVEVMEGGHNYLITRKTAASVSKSVFNEVEKAIRRLKVEALWASTPSRGLLECKNGYQILFAGLDDVEKIKSITPKQGVITDIWCEEATEDSHDDIRQLEKRLRGEARDHKGDWIVKRLILSLNPILRSHWIYKTYIEPLGWADGQTRYSDENIHILKTTHLDNDFLTPGDHAKLENEPDPYWREVYTLGNWGTLGDAILKNWRVEDLSGHEITHPRNGLDFGFAGDPAAFLRMDYDSARKRIYIIKGWSHRDQDNPAIAGLLKPLVGAEVVFCDSAEPKSIKELNDLGIDARAVKKGPDSILYSIQWLRQHEIIVDAGLTGAHNELATWHWKKDKYGEPLPIPAGKNDHYIDAMRYGLEIEYLRTGKGLDLS